MAALLFCVYYRVNLTNRWKGGQKRGVGGEQREETEQQKDQYSTKSNTKPNVHVWLYSWSERSKPICGVIRSEQVESNKKNCQGREEQRNK